jgi:hypothetical protein
MPSLHLRFPPAIWVRSCALALAALTGCADTHGSKPGTDAGTVEEAGIASNAAPDAASSNPSSGDAAPSPLAALDCVELELAAEDRIIDWLAGADTACGTDADCVGLVPRPSCVSSCTDAFISMRGEASLGPVIQELERGLCAEASRRCALREPVRCDQTQLEPRCEQGACRAWRKGCPDDPRVLEDLPCSEPGKICSGSRSSTYAAVCTGPIAGEYRWREHIEL